MKKCSKCKEEKDISNFYKSKRYSDGLYPSCKTCGKLYYTNNIDKIKVESKKYRDLNVEDIKLYRIKYNNENREKKKLVNKKWRENNKDKLKEYYIHHLIKDREKRKIYKKRYNDENRDKINFKNRERYKNDILFRLKIVIKSSISRLIKNKSSNSRILGCSYLELKLHLESKFDHWMTWDNYGLYNGEFNHGWDIDHIIPLSSARTEEELIRLNHYTNLTPLCSKVNRYIKKNN